MKKKSLLLFTVAAFMLSCSTDIDEFQCETTAPSTQKSSLTRSVSEPLCFVFNNFNEADMYTYTNPDTGMQYIYDKKKRVAFCHLTDNIDGDWILDDYGIRDWVESLPYKSISMAALANSYKIIGL